MLLPILYLKGVSTGDFGEALAALLGKDAPGLSASNIARLKDVWADEHKAWEKRDLSTKRYVYIWADGIHLQARLEEDAQCILVLIGATPEGKKELIGFTDGLRESAQSWAGLMLKLQPPLSRKPNLTCIDTFWSTAAPVGLSGQQATLYGKKEIKPSSLGVFHMLGNVSEWVDEVCGKGEYVVLGGSFADSPNFGSDGNVIPDRICAKGTLGEPNRGFRVLRQL